jgi:hypothetical protein
MKTLWSFDSGPSAESKNSTSVGRMRARMYRRFNCDREDRLRQLLRSPNWGLKSRDGRQGTASFEEAE